MGDGEGGVSNIEMKLSFLGGLNVLFDYLEIKLKYFYSNVIEKEGVVVKFKFLVNEDGFLFYFFVMNKVDDDL